MISKFILLVAAVLGVCLSTAQASAPDGTSANPSPTPYATIGARNIFHLATPPAPEPPPAAPPPVIKFTGITKTDRELKALFAIPPKDPKGSPTYVCLAEGESEAGIQLQKISADKEECEIICEGLPMTLSFRYNSYASSSALPPALPGQLK